MSQQVTVGVRYTGKREPFIDHLYKSKLSFMPGQVRLLPPELAKRFLKHSDVFERAETEAESLPESEGQPKEGDNTALLLEAAAQAKEDQQQAQTALMDLHDTIGRMDKAALAEFAQQQFRQPLDKRLSLENMREQVVGWVDQFGVAS